MSLVKTELWDSLVLRVLRETEARTETQESKDPKEHLETLVREVSLEREEPQASKDFPVPLATLVK